MSILQYPKDPQLDLGVSIVPELHARQSWVGACEFHALSVEEVLREVGRRVSEQVRLRKRPIVLLDLDSTLYEVGRRTHFILQEWAAAQSILNPVGLSLEISWEPLLTPSAGSHTQGDTHGHSHVHPQSHPQVKAAILRLKHEDIGYSIRDTFSKIDSLAGRALGSNGSHTTPAHLANAFEEVRNFWNDRFFTSSYLTHDRPYLGAVEFVRNLHALGAHIVYLTGRDEPNMGEGTRANLIRDGFPWDMERTQLFMKPLASMDDLTFKKQAASLVNGHGELIASFENEPPNVAALHELLPEVMHVFLDTVCSDHLARPRKGLYRIPGFLS